MILSRSFFWVNIGLVISLIYTVKNKEELESEKV